MKEIEYDGPTLERGNEHTGKTATRSKGSAVAPTVRTFRADVEELIEEKGTTRAQIVMAEEERRERRGESRTLQEEDDSHLGRIIFLLTLILAFALGVGAYVLIGTKISIPFITHESNITEEKPITTDTANILITDSPREQIVADLSITFGRTSLPQGKTRKISFDTKTGSGFTRPATTKEFLTATALHMPPDELVRSLSDTLLYGIYSDEKLNGFLQITSRSYPNTFSGMLLWEPEMYQDLTPILNPWYDRKNIKDLRERQFKDERIGTIDARVLRDAQEDVVVAYAFANKKTLIITNSTNTLVALVSESSKETVK